MNVFEALREDHEKQRSLITSVTKTSGDSQDRRDLFGQLKNELLRHARAEERAFYKPLIDQDLTQDKARHSIAEHKEIDDFIEEIESFAFDSPHWLPKAKELQHRLIHHLDEEEMEIFQLAGKALNEDQKQKLADRYKKIYEEEAR